MASLSTISDDFSEALLDTVVWAGTSGEVSVVNGRARIMSTTGYPALATAKAHTLIDSAIFAQAFPAPLGGATSTSSSYMSIDHPTTEGTRLNINYEAFSGTIRFHHQEGYWDNAGVQISYDPVAHRWWRFREDAGTTYLETSPDAATWTAHRTLATPAWITDGGYNLVFGCNRNDGETGHYFEIDNVNTVPSAVEPPVAPTGVIVTPAGASASLTWDPSDGATSYEVQYRPVETAEPWSSVVLDGPAGVTWTQTSGPAATVENSGGTAVLTPQASMLTQDITVDYVAGESHIQVKRSPTGIVNSDGSVTPTRTARVRPAPPPRVPLPTKVIGGYWEGWGTVSLGSVPAGYNTVFLCFATAATTGTAAVIFTQSVQTDASFRADIQALQSQGRPVLLSVGGWSDGGIRMLTEDQVTDMVESVAAIIEDYRLDGVDWDLEHLDQISAATVYMASRLLRERLGENLLITSAFGPSATLHKNVARLLGPEIDMAGIMFYDYPATHQQIVENTTALITTYGLDPSQVSVGFMSTTNANTMTSAELVAAYDEIEAAYPTLRGGYNWAISGDAGIGYAFLNEIAPAITNEAAP